MYAASCYFQNDDTQVTRFTNHEWMVAWLASAGCDWTAQPEKRSLSQAIYRLYKVYNDTVFSVSYFRYPALLSAMVYGKLQDI